MKTIRNIWVIVFASGAFAIANFWLNPNAPDLSLKPDEITLSQINRLPKNLVIVDARKSQDFKKGHVENAVNLSEEKFDAQLGEFLDIWTPDATVLVYCDFGRCNSSRAIADKLRHECQIENVFVLKDDWTKWKNTNK
nr:MAG TPA: Rhodanese-like domain [Caudoviricetes sp.]